MYLKREIERVLGQLGAIAAAGYAIGMHIRFASPSFVANTYPEPWIEKYTAHAFGLRDPMVGWGLSETGAIRWSALTIPDPFNVMAQARDFGLNFGAAISCGPLSSRSIVGMARSDREFTDEEISRAAKLVDDLHALTAPPTELTKAQMDALRCIAGGDRHAAAAAKLGITESALKARLIGARTRLLARTTSEAIQRALEYRLI